MTLTNHRRPLSTAAFPIRDEFTVVLQIFLWYPMWLCPLGRSGEVWVWSVAWAAPCMPLGTNAMVGCISRDPVGSCPAGSLVENRIVVAKWLTKLKVRTS